jgi:hypothetical protein
MEKNIILIIYRVILNILNFKMKNNELYLYVICGIIILYLLFTHFNFKSKLKRLGFLKSHRHTENFNTSTNNSQILDKDIMKKLLLFYLIYILSKKKKVIDKNIDKTDEQKRIYYEQLETYVRNAREFSDKNNTYKTNYIIDKQNDYNIELEKYKSSIYNKNYSNIKSFINSNKLDNIDFDNISATAISTETANYFTNLCRKKQDPNNPFVLRTFFENNFNTNIDNDIITEINNNIDETTSTNSTYNITTYMPSLNTDFQEQNILENDNIDNKMNEILEYYKTKASIYRTDTGFVISDEGSKNTNIPTFTQEKKNYDEGQVYKSLNNLKQSRRDLEYENNKPSQKYFDKISYLDKLKNNLETKMVEETENIKNHEKNVNEKLEKMESLQKYMNNMLDNNYDLSKYDFKSIKSLQNGLNLSIKKINNKNEYLIGLNKKCITLDNIGGYDIKSCDENNINQYFNINNIQNDINYKYNLEPGMILNRDVNPNGDLKYPFSILKSVNHQNCLQNNHNKISVLPCQSKKSQRWVPSKETIQCNK